MVTVASEAWTTLVLVREHLEFAAGDTSKDEQLKSMINRSYKILEKYLGRQMKSQTITDEYYDGDGTPTLLLKQWPINSVTSLFDDVDRDFAGNTEISSDDYLIYGDEGRIELYNDETIFTVGKQNVKITYNAGYDTIPDDLELASTIHVAEVFKKANNEGLLTKSLGGLSIALQRAPISDELRHILAPYRKRAV